MDWKVPNTNISFLMWIGNARQLPLQIKFNIGPYRKHILKLFYETTEPLGNNLAQISPERSSTKQAFFYVLIRNQIVVKYLCKYKKILFSTNIYTFPLRPTKREEFSRGFGTSCKYNFIPLHMKFILKINRKPVRN